jgi:cytoskeletal protein CcmA (bactofilin family)
VAKTRIRDGEDGMGVFTERRRRFLDPPRLDAEDRDTTVIAEGTRFDGSIRSAGGAVVAGTLDGDLEAAGGVLVLASGSVGGDVVAAAAKIEGSVIGSLDVSGRVEVDALGRVGGRVRALRLDQAGGATLSGPVEVEEAPHVFAERRKTPP